MAYARFGESSIGCGCKTYYGLTGSVKAPDPQQYMKDELVSALRPSQGGLTADLVLFGDGVAHGNGALFAKFIEDNNLGRVTASEIVTSPLHKEPEHKGYQVWLWYVDGKALKAFYDANTPKPAENPAAKKPGWPPPPLPPEYYGYARP